MHAPLPSSTRSRRVSGSPSRPSIPHTPTAQASPAAAGVSLQSWARSQYQLAQAQTPPRRPAQPTLPPAAVPMQLAQYQYSPRNLAAAERPRAAVADYFDPYRSPAPGQQTLLAVESSPRPTAPQAPVSMQAQPSSPVMRATRHSRPTTPTTTQVVHAQFSNSPSAQSSRDSLRSSGPQSPVAQTSAAPRLGAQPPQPTATAALYTRTAEVLAMPAFGLLADSGAGARTKPRAYATSDENSVTRPRVSSMYATSGFVPSSSSSSPQQADALPGSRLVRPIARPRQPQQQGSPTPPPPSAAPMERSELIDFIERRRAQTFATTTTTAAEPLAAPAPAMAITYGKPRASTAIAPEPGADAAPRMERSESVSSRQSDSSERSFKRSTARLADVTTTTTALLSKQPSADRMLPPRPTPPASWLSSSDSALGPPASAVTSSRVVPRTRALAAEPLPPQPLPPPAAASDKLLSMATRSNEALPPPRVFARSKRPESAHLERTSAGVFARGEASVLPPRMQSVSVQTDESLLGSSGGLKPLMADSLRKRPPVERAVQTTVTAADSIHSDEAVLDLMRQMDGLRMGHANQITEYQEQVLDMELLNQDLHNDVELLHARMEAMEAAHKRTMEDMRQRLDATRLRVDREIADVKSMHAAKCNELAEQVCLLLDRSEKYKARLEELGVTEDQLLQLTASGKGLASVGGGGGGGGQAVQKGRAIEQVQIVDQAFIERQYIETRESSQEADYFKQLMDIERSMENTTIALGFELKRTQAKYLEQAADFIREQMARFQTDIRAESRLSARSESRLSVALSPPQLPQLPPLPPLPTMHAEPLVLPPVPPSAQSLSVASYPSSSLAQALQAQHRRIAGAESPATPQSRLATYDSDSVDVSIGELRKETLSTLSANTMPPSQQRSFADSIDQQRRSATVSAHSQMSRGLGVHLVDDARVFGSESRVSGLSRMIGGSAPTVVASFSAGSDVSDVSMADLLLLSSGSPRRSHRSPLAAIASGFFSASQESMATAISHSDAADSGGGGAQHMLLHSSHATLVTPTKNNQQRPAVVSEGGAQPIALSGGGGSSMGYFSGHRKARDTTAHHSDCTPPSKPSTIHWPPRSSERRPSSRPNSMAIDTQDMTAEQLLESLKLPPTTMMGSSTPTRSSVGLSAGPGSLGRHSSPRPRAGSYSDLSRAFPASIHAPPPPPRFSVMSESPSSDSTLLQQLHASSASIASIGSVGSSASSLGSFGSFSGNKHASYVFQGNSNSKGPAPLARGSVAAVTGFDSRAEIKISLGLDKTPDHGSAMHTLGSMAGTAAARNGRTGKRVGPRRRSKSVGTWGASSSLTK